MARKPHKYHFTYKTVNLINGKYYVGMHSTSNLEDGYLGSGKRFRYSLNKYGKENFKREILEFFENKEKLIEAEINMITEEMLQDPLCMNIMKGGKGGFINDEVQFKWSQAGGKANWKKLKANPKLYALHQKRSSRMFKKTHKLGKINYNTFEGKKHTEETKKKLSEITKANLKINNGSLNTCWIHNENESIKIKKKELKKYLKQGWIKGRKMKF